MSNRINSKLVYCTSIFTLLCLSVNAQTNMCGTVDRPPDGMAQLALDTNKFWQKNNFEIPNTLRVKFLNGHPQVQNKIKTIVDKWQQACNIKFVFVSEGKAEIRINLSTDFVKYSSKLGTDALRVKDQKEATMILAGFYPESDESELRRATLHEFGHALGFIHEHQSPGANFQWDKQAVYDYFSKSPNFWTKEIIDANILKRANTSNHSDFDPQSIMLYQIPNNLYSGDYESSYNTDLSPKDIAYARQIYPFPQDNIPQPSPTQTPIIGFNVFSLINDSDIDIHYQLKNAAIPNSQWEKTTTIEAHTENRYITTGEVSYIIRFDSSFDNGYQEQKYILSHLHTKKPKEDISENDSKNYEFIVSDNSINLQEKSINEISTTSIICLINPIPTTTISYAMRNKSNPNMEWKSEVLEPNQSVTWSTNFSTNFEIVFDNNFTPGFQEERITLPSNKLTSISDKDISCNKGNMYEFKQTDGKVILQRKN